MADSQILAYVDQFADMIAMDAQQLSSRLRSTPAVIQKAVTGKRFSYDSLGEGDAIEVTDRYADTVISDPKHGRRWGVTRKFVRTILLDEIDELAMLVQPENDYARQCLAALSRQIDRVIVEAASASIDTGRNGGTTVTAANDGVITVPHGSAGMTYEKLLAVNENFIDNEIGADMGGYQALLITGQQNTNLMGEVELTSGDFRRDLVIEKGYISSAAGNQVIRFGANKTNPIIPISSTTRSCLALAERAICFGVSKDVSVKYSERADKNNAPQIQLSMTIGAVRTEGARVQIVQCTES